jgi:hypothetical protein
MSFGSSKERQVIKHAILEASKTNTLFFAAAGNKGPTHPEDFPANMPGVISIRAVDAPGGVQVGTNPSTRSSIRLPFATLGHNVPSTPLDRLSEKGPEIKSGSSVATVIAVSMAATLLRYVSLNSDKHNHDMVKEALASERGMTDMFRKYLGYEDNGVCCLSLDRLKYSDEDLTWSRFPSNLL